MCRQVLQCELFSTSLDMTSRVIFVNAFFAAFGNKSSMSKYDARAISNVD